MSKSKKQKIYVCSLTEFVRRFPCWKKSVENLLSDPDYIVKYKLQANGFFECIELGYADDFFAIDNQ